MHPVQGHGMHWCASPHGFATCNHSLVTLAHAVCQLWEPHERLSGGPSTCHTQIPTRGAFYWSGAFYCVNACKSDNTKVTLKQPPPCSRGWGGATGNMCIARGISVPMGVGNRQATAKLKMGGGNRQFAGLIRLNGVVAPTA